VLVHVLVDRDLHEGIEDGRARVEARAGRQIQENLAPGRGRWLTPFLEQAKSLCPVGGDAGVEMVSSDWAAYTPEGRRGGTSSRFAVALDAIA